MDSQTNLVEHCVEPFLRLTQQKLYSLMTVSYNGALMVDVVLAFVCLLP